MSHSVDPFRTQTYTLAMLFLDLCLLSLCHRLFPGVEVGREAQDWFPVY